MTTAVLRDVTTDLNDWLLDIEVLLIKIHKLNEVSIVDMVIGIFP